MNRHDEVVIDLINQAVRNVKAQPLNLGGVSGEDGGEGTPPGGFIGLLPQSRVTYDTTEAATLDTVGSGTLVDNLNHIRYRLEQVETGSGVLVVDEWDGSPSVSPTSKITFSGGVIVTDLGGGQALVTITASGSGDVEEAPIDGVTYGRKDGAWVTISGVITSSGCVVIDDLTSQITLSGTHFDLQEEVTCLSGVLLFYNGVYQSYSYFDMDGDGLGLTTDFPTYSGDTLVAVYNFGGGSSSGTGTDDNAIHDNVANEISAITEKTTLHNDDLFIIEDSEASFVKKKVKKSNVSVSGGGRTLIDSQTPTGTGTVTFSSISGAYQKLVLEYAVRGTDGAAIVTMDISFNNDTTDANYRREIITGYASTTLGAGGTDDNVLDDSVIAAGGLADEFSFGRFDIPFYANTSFKKQVQGTMSKRRDTSSVQNQLTIYALNWENTAAITEIDLILSAGNFAAGSIINLYGES